MPIPERILLIDGHPDSGSFCAVLAKAYAEGAREASRPIDVAAVRDLRFDPVLRFGYRQEQPLEPDLLDMQERIRTSTHVVWVAPMWWGGLPGLLKGFIDRTFIRGFSHRFDPARRVPVKLLPGRSATLIYTQSSPWLYTLIVHGDHFWRMVRKSIFEFVGFAPVRRRCYAGVKACGQTARARMIEDARRLGRQGY